MKTLLALTVLVAAAASAAEPTPLLHRFVDLAISPNGAIVASVEGDASPSGGAPVVRELILRRVKDGQAISVALPCGKVPQCWPGSPLWSKDGKQLMFTVRTPGTHRRAIYSVAADGSAATRLLEFDGTIENLSLGPQGELAMLATEHANKEVGATQAGAGIAGDADAAPEEQRIAVLESGSLHFVSPADLFVYEYDWRPDGRGFIGTAAHGDGDNNWWVAKLYSFDRDGPTARVIYAPPDARHQLTVPKVAPNGRSVAFIAGLMSDFQVTGGDVYTLPLAGEKAATSNDTAVNLTPAMPASASSLAWDCSGHLLAGRVRGANSELVDLGTGTRAVTPKVLWSGAESLEGPDGMDVAVSMGCPSGATATVASSFTAAPEIRVGALGRWRALTSLNSSWSLPAHAQSLTWKSDNFEVQGWLLMPSAAQGKVPMITIVHGGPSAVVTPTFVGPGVARALLEKGYALFLPNPRGSFGQGEAFTQANVRDFGYGDLRDILSGIDAAERVAPIDDARLGITGGSYGGYMTMWAVTQTQRFKAAVAGAGIVNWQSYYGQNSIDEWMIPFFGASVYEDPGVYARSSPITYIQNVRTPTFVFVGENDLECPAPQTQEFWHALKVLGVPTSMMIYPGEGHGLRDPAHIADELQRVLAWFDRYLR
ncbi:MAG TPA: S9 family peptidase [Steroidobacteraceae bacterium]|nr:S9 family peptidase [Steroidobacteraceae bacterium]